MSRALQLARAGIAIYGDTSGNVGIGQAPIAGVALNVYGHASLRDGYNLTWGGTYGAGIPTIFGVAGASGYLDFRPTGSTGGSALRIDSNNNIGIGGIVPTNTGLSLAQARNLSWQWAGNGYNYANIFNQTNSASLILASGYQQSATMNGFASSIPVSWDRSAINVGSGGIRFYTDASATVAVGTDITPTERMRIDSSGNVGIGTSSPDTGVHLRVYGNAYYTAQYGTGNKGRYGADATGAFIEAVGATSLTFYTNATERMRIDPNGWLCIGVTAETSLWSGQGAANGLAFNPAYSSIQNSTNSNLYLSKKAGYTAAGFIEFYINGSGKGSINTNGTTISYNTSSDYRLKENIAPMTGALAVVAQLKPCTYTWKEDGASGQGFIAHELQAVVPDAVHGEKDAVETYTDEEGNEQTRPKYQGIDTSFLVATLTAAIQEQQAIIESMKADIETLKAA